MPAYFSPAKLNLFLHITGVRADGYHNLQTLFQLLDYGDRLFITATSEDSIQLQSLPSSIQSLPTDGLDLNRNLIVKAAKLLQAHCGCHLGASIAIDKQIPIGAGLGGGSSNAATTLVALNQLWGTDLSNEALCQLGSRLGADVPLFIGGKNAFAEGIGDQLTGVQIPRRYFVILTPAVEVSTKAIFAHPQLAIIRSPMGIDRLVTQTEKLVDGHASLEIEPGNLRPVDNHCQAIVEAGFPKIAEDREQFETIIHSVTDTEHRARLTGTGSSLFAAFKNRKIADMVYHLALSMSPQRQWQLALAAGLSSP